MPPCLFMVLSTLRACLLTRDEAACRSECLAGQLPPVHKIIPTLDDALRRVRESVLPLEDQRQKDRGNSSGSLIGRILILNREPAQLRRNLTLILVNQVLGL
jgi:hypothetical protein